MTNKSKHTPGPWVRRSIPGHLFEIHQEGDKDGIVLRLRGGMVPMLADARLIAAAPELLAAARLVDAAFSHLGDDDHEAWAAIRAAIAKATGDA